MLHGSLTRRAFLGWSAAGAGTLLAAQLSRVAPVLAAPGPSGVTVYDDFSGGLDTYHRHYRKDTEVTMSVEENIALEELIRVHRDVNHRFFNGDPALDGWVHDDAITLHGGFGPSAKGWDAVRDVLTYAAARLSEGETTFTPLSGHVVGDLGYLVGSEQGTVRLDGGERRPMALRVTMIFRKVDGAWLAVHRHGEMVR